MNAPYAPPLLVRLAGPADVEGFLDKAARLAAAGRRPESVVWRVGAGDDDRGDLFCAPVGGRDEAELGEACAPVPSAYATIVRRAALHSDPERHALCYRILWRMRAAPRLLAVATDPDVARLEALARSVRRDMHKMTAFLRFRRVESAVDEEFAAWFEPDHHILVATAPFFARRFASMRWTILTPAASARWDGRRLTFGPGAPRGTAPEGDALEEVWRRYYGAIFNPARLNLKAMAREMPKKYWRNLPEADLIRPLTRAARARADDMIASAPTAPRRTATYRPQEAPTAEAPTARAAAECDDLDALASAVRGCTACDLCRHATQAVPGAGPVEAPLMFVGEQPGDEEDLAGRPFVGPAGRVFDAALERIGLDRSATYVTNAVKHFKFEPRGKKRIHKKPGAREIAACRGWLGRELEIVRPRLVVALGATAATALTGAATTLKAVRGRTLERADGQAMRATVHPSYLLRLPDQEAKKAEWRAFLDDLDAARRIAGL